MTSLPSVLDALANEPIEIFRETGEALRKPVVLYSKGKGSSNLLHLDRNIFALGPLPFPSMHSGTTGKFKEMISSRGETAKAPEFELPFQTNHDGITPFPLGASEYTRIIKTVTLRAGLDKHGFDAAIGSSRGDEKLSRAKERLLSVREPGHRWDPRGQMPELWQTHKPRLGPDQTMKFFQSLIGLSFTSRTTSSKKALSSARSISPSRDRLSGEGAQ